MSYMYSCNQYNISIQEKFNLGLISIEIGNIPNINALMAKSSVTIGFTSSCVRV